MDFRKGRLMPAKNNQNEVLTSNLNASLEDLMSNLKRRIAERAMEIAQRRSLSAELESKPLDVSLQDVSQATDEILGQRPISAPGILFFDFFPPFTCLCFLLCIVFGGLGLYAMVNPAAARIGTASAQGFLDVSKIFAGAIVGSTTSTALSSNRARKQGR